MSDVDAVQINFTAHFRWMDKGFHELLVVLGHPLSTILADGCGTPAVDARCNYLRPVQIDDVVELRSRIGAVGRSSFIVEHDMRLAEEPIARGSVKHVWIELSPSPRAQPVPEWLLAAFDSHRALE